MTPEERNRIYWESRKLKYYRFMDYWYLKDSGASYLYWRMYLNAINKLK